MIHQRRFGIPFVLLWALAHGMWIGAGWHAASQFEIPGATTSGAAHVCACSQRICKPKPAQATLSQVQAAKTCAICQLGILAPEVPASFAVATIAPSFPARGCIQLPQIRSAAPSFLPPSRAPPAA